MAFEEELGVLAPMGFWDPLGKLIVNNKMKNYLHCQISCNENHIVVSHPDNIMIIIHNCSLACRPFCRR